MDISLEHENFESVMQGDTDILKHSGSSRELFKKSESTGSIRFNSNESLQEQVENRSEKSSVDYSNTSLKDLRNKGSQIRKVVEADKKKKYEDDFREKIESLEDVFMKKVKVHEAVKEAYYHNARGSGPPYLNVKPKWANFGGWHNYGSFMGVDRGFQNTSPERCLFYFLDLMKKKGYFGENETINWELVDDDKGKYKGEKKIHFYWTDVSSLSPDVSPVHSPYNSSNRLEELGKEKEQLKQSKLTGKKEKLEDEIEKLELSNSSNDSPS